VCFGFAVEEKFIRLGALIQVQKKKKEIGYIMIVI